MLAVDGARRFIVGTYQLPKVAEPWQELREAGFNLLHTGTSPEELANARAHGLDAWVSIGSLNPAQRAQDEARLKKLILSVKDHPALLFWETEDEPSYIWKKPLEARVPPQNIIDTYQFVKRLDPARPFYLNHAPTNLVSTLRRYNGGADIVATDIYPVVPHGIREMYALWPDGRQGDFPDAHISQVGDYADKMRRVAGPARAVFMVLQGFAWEKLREKDQDPKMVQYPTRAELRFMAYQSIVHGANGIIYWGLPYTPPEAPLWRDLKSVTQELKALRTALAGRRVGLAMAFEYHDTGHSLSRGIEWIAKPAADAVLLIAANADPNPVDVSFTGLVGFRQLESLFESRQLAWENGKFRDSFPPFAVHVYRLKR